VISKSEEWMGAQTEDEGGERRGEERRERRGKVEEDVLTDFHRLIPPDRA
jgi:hypothetical protein